MLLAMFIGQVLASDYLGLVHIRFGQWRVGDKKVCLGLMKKYYVLVWFVSSSVMPLGIAMSHGDSIASLLCKILICHERSNVLSGVWSRI